MFATFAIFLREGIEASMIVSVLLAFLKQSDQSAKARFVIAGVISALATALVAGVVLYLTVHTYAGTRLQTVIETLLFLLAIVVLTYMTFWMSKHARDIPGALRSRAGTALTERAGASEGGAALFFVAYQAVVREGLEAMVFTLAIVFANGTKLPAIGAALGVAASVGFAFAVYRMGVRFNIAKAFKALGLALMVFAAALVLDAVENLQQLGWLNILNHPLWNSSSLLNEHSNAGDVAHALLGYAAQPTPLELVCYLGYLAVVVTIFLRITTTQQRSTTTRAKTV